MTDYIMKVVTYLSLFILCASLTSGQTEPPNGLRKNSPSVWALTGARVIPESEIVLENATIIIRDGLIENVGKGISIPKDAFLLDMKGKTIYPGFIESWMEVSSGENPESGNDDHWNFKVQARREMFRLYKRDEKKVKALHKLGFTTAHVVPDSGVFRGKTALIQLDESGSVLRSDVAQEIAYEVDGWGSRQYPNSLLGVIALIRQNNFGCELVPGRNPEIFKISTTK